MKNTELLDEFEEDEAKDVITNADKVVRQRCENDFLFFCRYFFKQRFGFKFVVNSHHEKIASTLQRVAKGEITRLLINMPPRYGKTEMAVINFIAWCLARDSSNKFIHLSYSDDLVLDNSGNIKELIESPEYQKFWPLKLKTDTQSKKKWYTTSHGGVYATSAGGAVTGFGAGSTNDAINFGGAIVVDDPLKPDDADSDTLRARVNNRINTTIKTRTNSRKTPIILIMQRIHDQDASGFVIDGGSGEEWFHLCIPVRDEEGQALWPWKHTNEELTQIETADRYTFSGQYMQQPVPDDGIFFTRDRFKWYDELPENLNFYGASDYAVSEGKGDFTEHGVFGIDHMDRIYVADWWSGQTKADVWIEKQLDLASKYKTQMWAGETGPIKQAVEPFLQKRMDQRRTYLILKWLSHAMRSKEANARTFQALVEAGKVYLPKNKPWATDLIHQLIRFPMGKYDDKVDVCSLFARMLNEMWVKGAPKPKLTLVKDSWDKAFSDSIADDNWKTA